MYKCEECGNEFELPDEGYAYSEYWGKPETEYFPRCPRCKSVYLNKSVLHCDICSNPIYDGDTYYKIKDGTYACEKCVEERTAKLW